MSIPTMDEVVMAISLVNRGWSYESITNQWVNPTTKVRFEINDAFNEAMKVQSKKDFDGRRYDSSGGYEITEDENHEIFKEIFRDILE